MEQVFQSAARLVWLNLDEIRTPLENELIYRRISPRDPAVIALAESVAANGLLKNLVVSADGYILDGNRRHVACKMAGLVKVECEIKDVRRGDLEFERLLVEYNRQRVKGLDEVLRETIVTSSEDGDAFKSLVKHRIEKAAVKGEALKLEGVKKRKRITAVKRPMLDAALRIIEANEGYWPLSDRSIHYEMLNVTPLRNADDPESTYANDRNSYQDLCDLLTRARLTGEIPFGAIADPTRSSIRWDVHRDFSTFAANEIDGFLKGFQRDRMQSQPYHIEIIGEKNTVESSIRDVAMEYTIPYTIGRGYSSLDPRYKLFARYRESGKGRLMLLIMSDFDPEGEDIASSFAKSMRDDFGIADITAQKVCLTWDQVLERDLPQTFDIKKDGSRYKKHAAKYGDRAHELEAITTAERARLLEEAIRGVLDLDAYEAEVEREEDDAERLQGIREMIRPALLGSLGGPQPD